MLKRQKRLTVADIRAMKGKHQFTMLRVATADELRAAEEAGIDMVSVPAELMVLPHFRELAPSVFAVPGAPFFEVGTADDFVRWAFRVYAASADAIYCSASLATVRRLADEAIPVVGHIGLVPSRATWTGGLKAVGKTAESAWTIFEAAKAYEAAGAFGAEIEVVPPDIATVIHSQTSLFLISMGSGGGCDCQYLFADDVLGQNRGHVPRHARRFRNFAAEFDRLQSERVAAFREFRTAVRDGSFPGREHIVKAGDGEAERFRRRLETAIL